MMDRRLRFVTLALAIPLGLGIAAALAAGEVVLAADMGLALAGLAGGAGWPE